MNIRDMQDSDLDALFREAADSAEFSYEEKSWESLVKRLDYSNLMKRIVWGGSTAGLILILSISAILYFSYDSPATLKITQNKSLTSPGKDNLTRQSSQPPVQSEIKDSPKPKVHSESFSASIDKGSASKTQSIGSMEKQKGPENVVVAEKKQTSTTVLENSPEDFDSGLFPTYAFILLEPAGLISSPLPVYNEPSKTNPPVIIENGEGHKRNPVSLVAGLTIGPEFSGVKFKESGSGMIEGISLTLAGNRFSFRTGIYHVKKNYAVRSGEYKIPDPAFLRYGKSPDHVAVSCHVIDIPLNVYYTILNRNGNRLYAGTGLSSYLMLTEEYSYPYGSAPNSYSGKFILRNENQHYFGILNLSAGFAKNITRNLSWEVEPYYKIPLTGIAAADVRLKSFGAFLSLVYKIK